MAMYSNIGAALQHCVTDRRSVAFQHKYL